MGEAVTARSPARARSAMLAGALVATLAAVRLASGADLANSAFTPLKAPDCLQDTSDAFVSENVPQPEPRHPSLPLEHYYMVVRFMGEDATRAPAAFDFSRIPADYGWPPVRGQVLTGLRAPEPRTQWQRARREDADLDSSSAFQLHCADAGSFINSWMFPDVIVPGSGAHSVYGFSFNRPPPPAIFDGDPGTDFVLQAAIEVPWFGSWPDTSPAFQHVPVGQVSLFAYFRARSNAKVFALLLGVFDNRAASGWSYSPFVAHDGATPFVSTPLAAGIRYATLSPYSSTFTGTPSTGLRFYRAHVSRGDFAAALADVNGYCARNPAARFCAIDAAFGAAFDPDPLRYEITDFGVLHEIFRGGPNGQLSMGVHVFDLGAWNAR